MYRTILLLSITLVLMFTKPSYAELIAYESFDYTEVGTDLNGKDGGTGFAEAWMPIVNEWGVPYFPGYNVAEGSLSFGGLVTGGNRVTASPALIMTLLGRELAEPLPQDESRTVYFSFLVRPEQRRTANWAGAGLVGGSGGSVFLRVANTVGISALSEGLYGLGPYANSPQLRPSNVPWAEDQTTFLVVKAELGPGADHLTLYTNPIPGLPEPETGTVSQSQDLRSLMAIDLSSSAANSLDEIRLGDTFGDVVPAAPVSLVEFIAPGESWGFFPGTEEPSTFPDLEWAAPQFDDSQWTVAQEGFGYGTEARGIVTTLDDMQAQYQTLYLRHSFTVEDPEVIEDLVLEIDYDDGFIAYINGQEVIRSSVMNPGTAEPAQATSILYRPGAGGVNTFLIEGSELLQPGDGNVLAIQGINRSSVDQDFVLSQISLSGVVPYLLLGDVNQDTEVNGLDVDPFVDVLLNGPFLVEADMNEDGVVNGLDVDPFVEAVVGGGAQQIPEPSSLLLALVTLGVIGGWRRWSSAPMPRAVRVGNE